MKAMGMGRRGLLALFSAEALAIALRYGWGRTPLVEW